MKERIHMVQRDRDIVMPKNDGASADKLGAGVLVAGPQEPHIRQDGAGVKVGATVRPQSGTPLPSGPLPKPPAPVPPKK